MKVLNMVKPENGDITFEVSRFPDGQQDIVLTGFNGIANPFPSDLADDEVILISRFNNFKDLELIICATKALKKLDVKSIRLAIPYLLGARSDRKFKEGGTSYLVDVVAPILNGQNYKEILVFDVHSNVAPACIPNLQTVSNGDIVEWALKEIYPTGSVGKFNLVVPDAGALHKVIKVSEGLGLQEDLVCCTKERDNEGKLSRVRVPLVEANFGKDFIIIDDICDGGRTFINIAKAIREITPRGKIYLIVTHGIFSAGFMELAEHLDGIYCTNSYSDLDVNQLFVKQFDLF